MTNDDGKSDSSVVLGSRRTMLGNGSGGDGGRGLAKEIRPRATRTGRRAGRVCQALLSGYGKQQERTEAAFTRLMHHVYDIDRLRAAYLAIKRDAAAASTARRGALRGDLEGNLMTFPNG